MRWEAMRTDETRALEQTLLAAGFARVDAYRYNSATIRVRVIDERFAKMPHKERHDFIDSALETLPEETQLDVFILLLLTPAEATMPSNAGPREARSWSTQFEFDFPTPSEL